MKKPSTGCLHGCPPCQPFAGDCTRQNHLNRSVDRLLKDQRIEPKAERQRSKALSTAGEIICGLCFFATLIGCAYLGMAC